MSRLIFAVSVLALTCAASAPASALSASECSTKYQAAKKDGTLGGQKWNDFRKAQCGADAQPAAATTTAPAAAPAPAPAPAAAQPTAKAAPAAKPAAPAASGSTVFPSKIDPKYASESAGKQRQKTCLDQYNVNKANGGNGGLNWIQKGGGYYSECNKRLKV
ncbi:hypothetical protein [Methylobacterium brachythecii]|uniref:Pyruvate/2-oxoglutarate dehydrogenase complex dihydrolipoamide acyltransferase (E2) component n=1 Tax=Methylobacterium brachythecii TaxID=1176177 RepID=A0A7W6AML8_9HYPH|nr:hypothetical protein [Methylobacterium brachythecii]MBB3903376.1 pyruvate/2-oxoglutarate dehydrogenase complex dihydrolipoamide acyltransferase (E2) component [Methylobacterium brachythecii]GLS45457.1 hypothetical protein GCM10007884_34470 [Methylobacterium brachythecii]